MNIKSALDSLSAQKNQLEQAAAKAKADLEKLRKRKSTLVAKAKAEAEKRISAELNIDQAEAEYADLLEQSRQLQKAINALAPAKKAATTDLVTRILKKLTSDGPISITEATAAIKEQLATKGMAATGLALRVKQALDNGMFRVENEIISRNLPANDPSDRDDERPHEHKALVPEINQGDNHDGDHTQVPVQPTAQS